ncbi:hypothetical protein DFR50_12410 [Roseiarcus fermentans]|uniref:Glutamine amidotransferase n=1 Tax=Roseiarcus fermentans TaxID=1473586 RepID=A0A366F1Z8_9HYPH|nr:hypothetical protein [Roseiarcus fermentans]RBP08624.1 hypothetical protein DFR50_12410 [Roseiarcus fermentans]
MTSWSIDFAPLVPLWLLYGLAAAALAIAAALVWRRAPGAWLRAAAFALALVGLADPNLVQENRRPLKDIVAVVVDRSESQQLGDRPRQTDQARDEVEARLKALGDVDLRVVETSRAESDTEGTRLFAALRGALADAPPDRVGGAILITDGDVHDIPGAASALGFNAPLHALITGHEGERQRRIELIEAPRYGIVGKDQTIAARVLDSASQGEPVRLTVRRDGETIATIDAAVGERIEVKTPIEHAGRNVVELEIAPVPGELTTEGDRAVVDIDGVRDKLRVLLVSGKPHPGERMWRNLLKSDANVDLVHFTILRPPEKGGDGVPINELSLIAFPVADLFGRKIKDFDLIIFDRYAQQSILPYAYLENIADYVRRGGALLMAEGPEYSTPDGLYYSPLGAITPAEPTGEDLEAPFRPQAAELGLRHPVTRGLVGPDGTGDPPTLGRWFRLVGAKATDGQTVMTGPDNRPLLVLSRVDKGRVALLLSDQIWLWARGYDGGGPYLDLLRRLAHWLMKEPELEEEALRASAHGRAITVERQSVSGEARETVLIGPDGTRTPLAFAAVAPGLSRAQTTVDRFGLYRAEDGEHVALVNVGPENPLEMRDVVSTTEKLRPLAEATGGSARRLSETKADDANVPRIVGLNPAPFYAGGGYIGIKRTGSSELIGARSTSLASGFFGLAVLLGMIVAGWMAEAGRFGRRPKSPHPKARLAGRAPPV